MKGATGSKGLTGAAGLTGPQGGVVYPGQMHGLVVSAASGAVLPGATVTVSSAGTAAIADASAVTTQTVTTAADGTFNVSGLAVGDYVLIITRTGYVGTTVPGVLVNGAGATNLTVSMSVDAKSSDGMTVTLADNLTAGFDSTATLTATVSAPDADAGGLTYKWTQTGGLPVQVTGATTTSISFQTLSLSSAKLEANPAVALGPYDAAAFVPARFGPMAFGVNETGDYQFSFTVTDAVGHSLTTGATVQATPPTNGLRSAPLGLPVWFEGDSYGADGGAQTTWAFTLAVPSGSKATLTGADTQFPRFTPDVAGSYTVAETVSGKSAAVYGADWDGISGIASQPGTGNDYVVQGCTATCHVAAPQLPWIQSSPTVAPDMFKYWATTKHARALSDGLDGLLGPDFGPSCLPCHTLGDSTAATNGGFGNVATADSWTFPSSLATGNYASLLTQHPDLVQLGNVQCESCHGPKNLNIMGVDDTAARSFSSGVCAQCHSQFDQWKTSLHANLQVAINEGASSANCARCHSAQGFVEYAQELRAGCVSAGMQNCLLTSNGKPPADGGANAADGGTFAALGLTASTIQSQTCAGCHDPHDVNGLPYQLRVDDSVPFTFMNGVSNAGVGLGATCMICHNSRPTFAKIGDDYLTANNLTAATTLITPHNGTQTDVLFGTNAYFAPRMTPSPHLAVADTCAGCHLIPTATQKAAGASSNHAFATDVSICSTCHAAAFNGADVQAAATTQLAQLDQAIFGAVTTLLQGAVTGSGSFNTTVRDATTLNYLCVAGTGTPSVYFSLTSAPPNLAPFAVTAGPPVHTTQWRNLGSALVTYPAASNPFKSLTGLAECGSTTGPTVVPGATYAGGPVVISISAAQAGATHSSSHSPIVSAASITGRAIYNEALLNNDLSRGVHNPPFAQSLVTNTIAKLATVTTSTP